MSNSVTPHQRLEHMRKSFEKDKTILTDDYEYFTGISPKPRVPTHQNKAARKLAEQHERQSRERSEMRSLGKTGD